MERRVAFEAEDVAAALAMLEREPIGEWAELSSEGEVICRRGHEPGGAADYWVVDSGASPPRVYRRLGCQASQSAVRGARASVIEGKSVVSSVSLGVNVRVDIK